MFHGVFSRLVQQEQGARPRPLHTSLWTKAWYPPLQVNEDGYIPPDIVCVFERIIQTLQQTEEWKNILRVPMQSAFTFVQRPNNLAHEHRAVVDDTRVYRKVEHVIMVYQGVHTDHNDEAVLFSRFFCLAHRPQYVYQFWYDVHAQFLCFYEFPRSQRLVVTDGSILNWDLGNMTVDENQERNLYIYHGDLAGIYDGYRSDTTLPYDSD